MQSINKSYIQVIFDEFLFDLENLMMMWKKDNQLLILNNKVLTQESSRIKVTPLKGGNILSVKRAKNSDAGTYSCQVSYDLTRQSILGSVLPT